ncbi:MAG: TetR/AcrR family transcriptional regulator [Propioniciclava sp.]|uniref:TetR/AcrR family transcriptional regulator n=1 Tax=Propioniciclava sp. TaxID=2038686 RepID=UPI0039E2CE59
MLVATGPHYPPTAQQHPLQISDTEQYSDTSMYIDQVRTPAEPATRLTRKESQQTTRARLVASAITLFARQGVGATSLNAVAEHAGFSRGAVHGNYTSKDELAAAVAATVADELTPQLQQTLTSPLPSGERLTAYIHTFLDYCAQNPDAAGALIAVFGHRGRVDPQHYRERAMAALGDLIALFEEGQCHGEMRAFDTTTMAFALRTVLDNTAALLRDPGADAGALAAEIAALFTAATREEGPA